MEPVDIVREIIQREVEECHIPLNRYSVVAEQYGDATVLTLKGGSGTAAVDIRIEPPGMLLSIDDSQAVELSINDRKDLYDLRCLIRSVLRGELELTEYRSKRGQREVGEISWPGGRLIVGRRLGGIFTRQSVSPRKFEAY